MIDFKYVEQTVRDLKTQLTRQQIDEKAFEDKLLTLIDVAEDGYYWMFGHESEQWYRHDGETWLPDDPQNITTRPTPPNNPGQTRSTPPVSPAAEPLSWVWFIISLILLAAVGSLVYNSAIL